MRNILRFIGRIIGGALLALIMMIASFFLRRALKKAQQQAAQPQPQSQPQSQHQSSAPRMDGPAPFRNWAVRDTIYEGMNSRELIAAYGTPDRKETLQTGREVWTYGTANANDNAREAMTVTLDRGVVVDWV